MQHVGRCQMQRGSPGAVKGFGDICIRRWPTVLCTLGEWCSCRRSAICGSETKCLKLAVQTCATGPTLSRFTSCVICACPHLSAVLCVCVPVYLRRSIYESPNYDRQTPDSTTQGLALLISPIFDCHTEHSFAAFALTDWPVKQLLPAGATSSQNQDLRWHSPRMLRTFERRTTHLQFSQLTGQK